MRVVHTSSAPAAIGPYSQAIVHGDLVFCSGQIGVDPATGQVVPGGVEAETRQVFENIEAVLAEAGSGLSRVLKATVFLKSMNDFGAMNAIYAASFGETRPARSTVEVSRLPRDVRVEIEVVATRG
jgi:2-iminobutanoate/2-iminopropanoate deaminase